MKYLIILFLSINILLSNDFLLSSKFSEISDKYNIDKNLLLAIAFTESKFNKYSIGVMAKNKKQVRLLHKYFKFIGNKYEYSNYYFNVMPKNLEEAKKVLMVLDYFNVNYDLGITQINLWNIKKRKIDKIRILDDELYAIKIGAIVLSECIKYNKSKVFDSIECYNKGTDKSKYNRSYSIKVLNNYNRIVSIMNKGK